MKNLILILILVFLALYGCKEKLPEKSITHKGVITIISDGNQPRHIKLYVIDSCEYIGHVSGWRSDFLTHKGNCKFCKIRND